jgi:dephospho-CoA kinase
VRLVALTGGIGSGKSSVSARLGELGAFVIDADAVVKELQEPGGPVLAAMVERWGDRIVGSDGALDRQAVAAIVFGDVDELAALNGIVHPAVWSEMRARVDAVAATDRVIILDIPLLAEAGAGRWGASAVIVVDCPVELAVERLVEQRGLESGDAEARIRAQASRKERLALADHVIDNSGGLAQLEAEVARCWAWLVDLEPTPWPPPGPPPGCGGEAVISD